MQGIWAGCIYMSFFMCIFPFAGHAFLLCTVQPPSAANLLCKYICFPCNAMSCCCTFTSVCSWDHCSYLFWYRYPFYYIIVHQSASICSYSVSFSTLNYQVLELSLLLLLSLISLGAHLSACHPSLSRHSHLTVSCSQATHPWIILECPWFHSSELLWCKSVFRRKITSFCVAQAVHIDVFFFLSCTSELSTRGICSSNIPTFFLWCIALWLQG